MIHAAPLEQAIYQILSQDSALLTLLGGLKIYDIPQREASFPYITLAIDNSDDWSTGTEEGEEHRLQIHVWTGLHERARNHAILKQIAQSFQDSKPDPTGCHLITMHRQAMFMQIDRERQIFQGTLRYRALTEQL